MPVITIGGLTGGGGRLVGPIVAQRLGADYVDRLILTNTARRVGATVEALHEIDERPPTRGERFSRILQRILERSAVTGAGGDPYFGPGAMALLTQEYEELPQPTITKGHEVEDDHYVEAMREVMEDMAKDANVVIVGRGGSVILKDNPNVLRVGIVAHLEDRVKRIMEREKVGRSQAEEIVAGRDQARVYNFKRFFDLDDPEAPELYHMTINSSDVNLEYAADLVIAACDALKDGRLAGRVPAAD